MSALNEQYLNRLYDDLQTEKSRLFLELKNDKELVHERVINQKLTCIDSMLRSLMKLRNIQIKDMLKCNL